MSKEKKGKEKRIETIVELPETKIKPANRRIFCHSFIADEVVTKGGIILPGTFEHGEAKAGQKRELKRFLVVAVADDNDLETSPGVKLKRGDEIYPQTHPNMVAVDWPILIDFGTGKELIVLEQMEVVGCVAMDEEQIIEKDKEDSQV